MIILKTTVTTAPQNFRDAFIAAAGETFDAGDYADETNLWAHEIDQQDIKAAQHKASQLNPGEFLVVTHEDDEE